MSRGLQNNRTTRRKNSYNEQKVFVFNDASSSRGMAGTNRTNNRHLPPTTRLNKLYLWNITKSSSLSLTTKSANNDEGDEWKHDIKCINNYPLNIDMVELAQRLLQGEQVRVPIINSYPFNYLHSPYSLCSEYKGQQRLRLVILVKSAVPYNQLRHVIRQTWGKSIRKLGMVYAFLLGFISEFQRNVDGEANSFHDIIQENFVEAYRNNTYKTIMAYNWVVQYCPMAEKVLLLDDDVYLTIKMLKDAIEAYID